MRPCVIATFSDLLPEVVVSSHICTETITSHLEVDTHEDKWREDGKEPQRKRVRKKEIKNEREQQRKRERGE